ncbi:MAG: hypothetical protein ACI9MR_002666 [Myxococcota bacterium]|jgi:hypothetical protein
MSKRQQNTGDSHARQARPSPNSQRPEVHRDGDTLRALPYKRGHLTDEELTLFAQLRGPVTAQERAALKRVAETLRRPPKRLKALDLMRYWGVPLSPEQRVMLPWFAGLKWHRPLPGRDHATKLDAKALARHLLCIAPTPDFLFEPFAHPMSDRQPYDQWPLCRVLGVVGGGGGLDQLRELDMFWTWVEPEVFQHFLATPDGVSVLRALIAAFVSAWSGPPWLSELAVHWQPIHALYSDLYPFLRVAYGLCRNPRPLEEADAAAHEELARIPRNGCRDCFGESKPLPIPNAIPVGLTGWHAHELRTPADFEDEDAATSRIATRYFRHAHRGEMSLWSLRREGRPRLTVRIEIGARGTARMRASLLHGYEGRPSDDDRDVMTRWAHANGIRCDFNPRIPRPEPQPG